MAYGQCLVIKNSLVNKKLPGPQLSNISESFKKFIYIYLYESSSWLWRIENFFYYRYLSGV